MDVGRSAELVAMAQSQVLPVEDQQRGGRAKISVRVREGLSHGEEVGLREREPGEPTRPCDLVSEGHDLELERGRVQQTQRRAPACLQVAETDENVHEFLTNVMPAARAVTCSSSPGRWLAKSCVPSRHRAGSRAPPCRSRTPPESPLNDFRQTVSPLPR